MELWTFFEIERESSKNIVVGVVYIAHTAVDNFISDMDHHPVFKLLNQAVLCRGWLPYRSLEGWQSKTNSWLPWAHLFLFFDDDLQTNQDYWVYSN